MFTVKLNHLSTPALTLLLGISGLCMFCCGAFVKSAQAPSHTKIIDNFSTLGIDQLRPRFAWILNDKDRTQLQTAYQIMVIIGDGKTEK